MAAKVAAQKMARLPNYDIVLTQLKHRRGELSVRGKSVEIAQGLLNKEQMNFMFNELLKQRRAYLFDLESKCRSIEYQIKIKRVKKIKEGLN